MENINTQNTLLFKMNRLLILQELTLLTSINGDLFDFVYKKEQKNKTIKSDQVFIDNLILQIKENKLYFFLIDPYCEVFYQSAFDIFNESKQNFNFLINKKDFLEKINYLKSKQSIEFYLETNSDTLKHRLQLIDKEYNECKTISVDFADTSLVHPLRLLNEYSKNKNLSVLHLNRDEFRKNLINLQPLYTRLQEKSFMFLRGLSITINENNNLIEFVYANNILVNKIKASNIIDIEVEKNKKELHNISLLDYSFEIKNNSNQKAFWGFIFEEQLIKYIIHLSNNNLFNLSKDLRFNIYYFDNDVEYIFFEYGNRVICYHTRNITYVNTHYYNDISSTINRAFTIDTNYLKQILKDIIKKSSRYKELETRGIVQFKSYENKLFLKDYNDQELEEIKIIKDEFNNNLERKNVILVNCKALALLKIIETFNSKNIDLFLPDETEGVLMQIQSSKGTIRNSIPNHFALLGIIGEE